jgi:DNA-binding GntR family transcriptional regulator
VSEGSAACRFRLLLTEAVLQNLFASEIVALEIIAGVGENERQVHACLQRPRIADCGSATRCRSCRISDRMPSIVRPQSLSDRVYEELKGQLMDRVLAPGAKINIDQLCRELEVSQTPIREALARLESDGLVTKRALAGYTVAPLLDVEGFEQLFEMRLLLEPEAAAHAAKRMSPAQHKDLSLALSRLSSVEPVASYEAYRAFAHDDAKFHLTIADMSGNRLLFEALERLHIHQHMYRRYSQGMTQPTVAEHRQIMLALKRRDSERAAAAMVAHLEQTRARLWSAMDEQLAASAGTDARAASHS